MTGLDNMHLVFGVIISYLIGSIPTGLLIAKSKGKDLRKIGSGNIGATNVMRALGKEAAFFTLMGDVLKGTIPVAAVNFLGWSLAETGLIGIAAIMGHNFSLFLRFKGGKGVATSIGVLLAFSAHVALLTITIWIWTAKRTRYSSLSALIAFGLLPLGIYLLDYSKEKIIIGSLITALIFIMHTANIKRLIQGTESKIGEKA